MIGPCMCGDLYCSSCGPAQGNSKCPYCGTWSSEGECPDPEKCKKADEEYCKAMAEQIEWEKNHPDYF